MDSSNVLLLVLEHCDINTVMNCRLVSSNINNSIEKYRNKFPRYKWDHIIVQKFSEACDDISMLLNKDFNNEKEVTSMKLIKHFHPKSLLVNYKYMNLNEALSIYRNMPHRWSYDIEEVIATIPHQQYQNLFSDLLNKINNISSLYFTGYSPYSKLSDFLLTMKKVKEMRLQVDNENLLESDDDDLTCITLKSDELSLIVMDRVNNNYSFSNFVDFLNNGRFGKHTSIRLMNWIKEPSKLINWLSTNTKLKSLVYTSSEYFAHPTHLYFDYRDVEFKISFVKPSFFANF